VYPKMQAGADTNLVDGCRNFSLPPRHMVRISITWKGGPQVPELLTQLPNRYGDSVEYVARLDGHGYSFRADNGHGAHSWVAAALEQLRKLGATDLGVETTNVVFAQF
jgi:hypothetical protein